MSYTGRPADGTTSRALRLQEKPFCVQNSQFFNAAAICNSTPITIAFWFNPLQFIDAGDAGGNTGFGDNGTQMLNIRRPTDGWPSSDWGYMWSGIHNGGNDYWVNIQRASQAAGVNYTTMTQNFVIPTANWTHIAISVIGNSTSNKDVQLYVNGRKVSDAVQNKATGLAHQAWSLCVILASFFILFFSFLPSRCLIWSVGTLTPLTCLDF